MTGKAATLTTPEKNFHVPIRDPEKGLNAWSAQITNSPLSGKAVESYAVMRAFGTLHMKGKIKNPKIASSGPAACTVGSSPKGPPATSK